MNYQVLARKWRPHNFTEVVGQEHVVKSLVNALQHDRLHHAYLFTGTRGVGKTTLARILAKAVNCENLKDGNPCGVCRVCKEVDEGRFLDLIEVDAASRTKVEDTRDLLDNAQYAPNLGRYKVYLIDEVHMLSGHSFNALLKTLEEPPAHVKFLLATTDPQKIPVTVLSRCLQFNLKRLLPEQIFRQMEFILQQEKIEFEAGALKLLAKSADGSMRDGLSLLDQAIAYGEGIVSQQQVAAMLGTVAQQPVGHLLSALADADTTAIFDQINELANLTPDFAEILSQILQVLHRIAVTQQIPGAIDHEFDADMIADLASKILPEDLELAPDARSGFEMVMLRMLTFKPVRAQMNTHVAPPKPLAPKTQTTPPSPVAVAPTVPQIVEAPPVSKHLDHNATWPEIIAAIKIGGMTRELANNCVLDSLDNKTCTLLLDPGHKQLRSAVTEDKLQKALQTYYGSPIKLVIQAQKTAQETPALQLTKERADRQQAAVDAIDADENILALKDQFDARILPGSIEPI